MVRMAGAVPRLLLCAVLFAAAGAARQTWPTPLVRAYAHNDQENGDPLLPALNAGFCNVEPDVFLQDGVVVIGHNCNLKACNVSLEDAYIRVLADRFEQHGAIQPLARKLNICRLFTLNIDVKTSALPTFDSIHAVLERYAQAYPGLFRTFEDTPDGVIVTEGAVLVTISGERPSVEYLRSLRVRYAALDGRILDNLYDDSKDIQHVYPWLSQSWSSLFDSVRTPFDQETRQEVMEIVATAAARGQLVRFWSTPNTVEFYDELVSCDVPLLNNDIYDILRDYLLA